MNNLLKFEQHTGKYTVSKRPFIYHSGDRSAYRNWHENIEILYVIKGSGVLHYDSLIYNISEGDLVIINSFAVHYTEKENNLSYHVFIPYNDYFSSNGLNLASMNFTPIVRDISAKEKFIALIDAIAEKDKLSEAKIRLAAMDFLIFISENHSEKPQEISVKKIDLSIRQALSCILSNYSEDISAEAISKHVGFSKFHFLRQFKNATGLTFSSFLNSVRIDNAKKLLSETNLPIKEICYMTGFESEAYFSKIFKEKEGYTPSEYRKKEL
ncbi:MAG: AraC family transcriptional regulator [Clostridia bacterium]|nr:AraC family transcriptional regulator [Clostridia bacterium]